MDNRELITLAKIVFIIFMTAVGGVVAFLIGKFVMPMIPTITTSESYTASVQIYVESSVDANADGTVNTGEIATARTLAETDIIVLNDISLYERIADRFMDDYDVTELQKAGIPLSVDEEGNQRVSPSYIQSCVSISSVNESEILAVTATCEEPQIAKDICDYMVEVAPDVLRRVLKAGSVEAISPAKLLTTPNKPDKVPPNVTIITLIGVFVGFAGSLTFVLLLTHHNKKKQKANQETV